MKLLLAATLALIGIGMGQTIGGPTFTMKTPRDGCYVMLSMKGHVLKIHTEQCPVVEKVEHETTTVGKSTGGGSPIPQLIEPMDIPAVKVCEETKAVYTAEEWRTMIRGGCITGIPKLTCADESRILLTAEDGSKHCLKFPKENQ